MRRIDPQPVTLSIVPVTMTEDEVRREALAAARGRDLFAERFAAVVRFLGVVVLALAAVRMLTGCAALGPGLQTARDVAKVGCAILEGTDGTSADVLARTAELQRAIVEASAARAKERSPSQAAAVDQLVASVAVLARALADATRPVIEASGNVPARLAPCPVSP